MNYPSPLLPLGRKRSKGKSTFFFRVMLIFTAHVVVIGGLLLQGCKQTKETVANQPLADLPLTPIVPSITTIPTAVNTNVFSKMAIVSPIPAFGQKAAVGAVPLVSAPSTAAAPVKAVITHNEAVYKVKPGDTLVKIARLHHTTYQKIMALNDLKSANVKSGQMLQLPAPKASEAPVTAMN
jgi:LysM repeat protein